jgi:hypothetical protein
MAEQRDKINDPRPEGRRGFGRWPSATTRVNHGYEPTREAAMAAFAKSWRRE